MAKFDSSKSQQRACDALGIAWDVNDSYVSVGDKLEAAGVPADGLPFGLDFRAAKKLTSAELVVAFAAGRASEQHYHDTRSVEY